MSASPGARPSLDEFERLADAHVTPHMLRLGYARIGATENAGASRGPLVAVGGQRRRSGLRVRSRERRTPEAPRLAMGYEARDEAAASRVYPGDPQTGEEIWLYVEPASGALELHAGMPLGDLLDRYGDPEDRLVVLTPDQPLASRLARLGQVLDRYVGSLLSP